MSPDKMKLHIMADIGKERLAQDRQWGGPEHDDQHHEYDWLNFMGHQADRISEILVVNSHYGFSDQNPVLRLCSPVGYELTRQHFIKIAALAVAAVESMDRKSEAKK